ncbi:u4:u6.u5 tri snrnp associated protein 1 [Trichuris trichiura]|uniref:U4:u6.u5 tri snrnp associated protein 1 n=1 Tax=Trichuris trichiura TaxID=36087 RepID=A0A077Z2S9_TRITR|nr:u4:u6.u5 tri snrnp associated protein 1 [Trichuris trichiura]
MDLADENGEKYLIFLFLPSELVTVDGSQFVHKPAADLTTKKEQQAIREKLQTLKEKRKLLEKFKLPFAVDDSASAWVLKSTAQNRRIIIRHVFVLKLTAHLRILEVLDEGEDVLINPALTDYEKWEKNVENRKRKPDYNPFEFDEFDEMGLVPSISFMLVLLKKYDEVLDGEKKDYFKLGDEGIVDVKKEAELLRLRAELRKGEQSLESAPKQLAREYYTPEEMVQFKKPKKRVKKIRKTNPSAFIDEIAANAVVSDMDYGSRSRGRGRKKEEYEEATTTMKEEPADATMDALSSIVLASDDAEIKTESLDDVIVEDEAEEELQTLLSRARRAKLAERCREEFRLTADKISEITCNRSNDEVAVKSEQPTAGVVFDSISEYCRGLGDIPTYGRSGNREATDIVYFDTPPVEEEDEEEKKKKKKKEKEDTAGKWVEADFMGKPKKHTPSSDESDEEVDMQPVLEAEPEASHSVTAALKLATRKGYLGRSGDGNAGNLRLSHLQAKKFTIIMFTNRFFSKINSDIDDKYAKKLERMGSSGGGPVTDFKEKRGYQPEVKLEYADESGRLMDAKDAFRYLSWKFHGKTPGKRKIEKRTKKAMENELMNQMSSTDTPLHTLEKQLEKQKQLKAPYIVLSGSARKEPF